MKRADREAHIWLDRMKSADADQHRAAFEEWLRIPGNAPAYADALDDYEFSQGFSRTRMASGARPKATNTGGPRWAFATVLAAAIALGAAWLLLGNGNAPQLAEVPAESRSASLVDGTRVMLMDGATMSTRFGAGERRVLLTGGRARFEVAHDAARPFIVEGGGSETVALGTIFEVNLLDPRVPRVALVDGSVEVRGMQSRKTIRLRPGETAEVPLAGPRIMTGPAARMSPGRIEADETPLREVLADANRTNTVPIRLADAAIGELRITGNFEVGNSAALARQLAAALDLDVSETAEGLLLRVRN